MHRFLSARPIGPCSHFATTLTGTLARVSLMCTPPPRLNSHMLRRMTGCACASQSIVFARAATALVPWPMPEPTNVLPHVSSPIFSFNSLRPSRARRVMLFLSHYPLRTATSATWAFTGAPQFIDFSPGHIVPGSLPTPHSYICLLGSSPATPQPSLLRTMLTP